jgi:hypothetical protein
VTNEISRFLYCAYVGNNIERWHIFISPNVNTGTYKGKYNVDEAV